MVTLEACPLFRELNPRELKTLRQAAQEKTFPANQEIFKEGDTGDGVYVVREGQVQISGGAGDNNRFLVSRVAPGEIFGEMAGLENKPRSASAGAAGAR